VAVSRVAVPVLVSLGEVVLSSQLIIKIKTYNVSTVKECVENVREITGIDNSNTVVSLRQMLEHV